MGTGEISVREFVIECGVVILCVVGVLGYIIIDTNAGIQNASANGQPGRVAEVSIVEGDYTPMSGGPTFYKEIYGFDAQCVKINTDRWGHDTTYDPDQPEISTAWGAMEGLKQIGYLEDQVIVIQGDAIRVVDGNDPVLGMVANGTEVCGVDLVNE